MLTAKGVLVWQLGEAFRGRADMSLMGVLAGITQEEASWRGEAGMPTVEEIVRHIAGAMSRFGARGLGEAMVLADEGVNGDGDSAGMPWEFPCGAAWGRELRKGIVEAVALLEEAQEVFVKCLENWPEEKLEEAIPTHHGKSAANFFWVMMMHDIYHAGQIRTRRTMFKALGRGALS